MSGRLGMTGLSAARGDKAVGLQISKAAAPAAPARGPLANIGRFTTLKPTKTQYANWALDAAGLAAGVEVLRRSKKKKPMAKRDGDHRVRNTVVGTGAGAVAGHEANLVRTSLEISRIMNRNAGGETPTLNTKQVFQRVFRNGHTSRARELYAPPPGMQRLKGVKRTVGALAATGGAVGYAASHKKKPVEKRDGDHSRRNSVIGGTLAGAGGTDLAMNVGGWVTREGIKMHERKVDYGMKPHPTTRNQRKSALKAHRALHGITSGTAENADQAYYRTYPKGLPAWKTKRVMGYKNTPKIAGATLAAGTLAGTLHGARRKVEKVDTTMSDHEAKALASRYDTRGPLPKGLTREQKMKAYEARYVASGGKQGEKWKRRADHAEAARNVGLAGATGSAAALMATRGKRSGKLIRNTPVLRHVTSHRAESAALGSALLGGSAELYGEHARNRRASYANTPAGVAGSALSRMRAYTPGGQQ